MTRPISDYLSSFPRYDKLIVEKLHFSTSGPFNLEFKIKFKNIKKFSTT